MTAIEDLHSFAAITEAHAEGTRTFIPAFEALYQAMPAEQQALPGFGLVFPVVIHQPCGIDRCPGLPGGSSGTGPSIAPARGVSIKCDVPG
jgi:hypothetical protein